MDLEKLTLSNTKYRKVLITTKQMQLVLMSLKPEEDIERETHKRITQFFRIEAGTGYIVFEILKLSNFDVGRFILRIPKRCLSLRELFENSLLDEIAVQSILESKTSIFPLRLML